MAKNDIIFGIRTVLEALSSGKEIEKVLIKKGLQGELFQELLQELQRFRVPFQFVPIERINRVTRKNHQGVVAFVSAIEYQRLENVVPLIYEKGETPLLLILDKISDVRNFGAIARTAECGGVHAIVIPAKGAAQINADAIKTSAGALHHLTVCREPSLKKALKFLAESGIEIVAATEKASEFYYEKDLSSPLAIVMGAEDKGVSPEILKTAGELVKIPVAGQIESLNVSVAAAVLVYEALRQRALNG